MSTIRTKDGTTIYGKDWGKGQGRQPRSARALPAGPAESRAIAYEPLDEGVDTIVRWFGPRVSGVMAAVSAIYVEGAIDMHANIAELRRLLVARRHELTRDIGSRMRDVRENASMPRPPVDSSDTTEVSADDDTTLALIEMKSEVLARINEALGRMVAGTYGRCVECEDEIAEARLRALPFAVRCKECQERREHRDERARALARRGTSSLGFDIRH